MPEGPSLILFTEDLQRFAGQKILEVSGNSKIDQQRLVGKKIKEIKTWGKHMLWRFDDFTVKIHFLMFGTYYINSSKDAKPRLYLRFQKDELNLYSTAIKILEEPLDEIYDWTADVLNPSWDAKAARKKLKAIPDAMVTDALLNQEIFSGVGNIIKNEILFRIKVHPESLVGALPPRKLTEMIKQASVYSYEFLAWKREYVLKKNWQVHTKKTCPRDGAKICKAHLGKTDRRTFWCEACQVKYE
ncbi:DNA-formamidopyrimidine glycosylase family protein [Flavisolibacter ginsenosidimutans]|uniref:Endonuclease n=1 Tax=Flavisolibacter ginsenosidimutans TaxID=661481 RepID=A0A5B8UMD1_9BACT|nr:DNA-formamidopyrimidine glycosylase family protein [Flavisolibacter ginsenosidimutans]QEC57713.1 endonuclease [Flavisolibacter ginsenosidimutans]